MIRVIYSISVILFFLGAMTLLFRDHVIPDFTRPDGIAVDRRVLTDSWVDVDEYQTISLAGKQIGVIRMTSEREYPETETRRDLEAEHFYLSATQLEIDLTFLKARVVGMVKLNRRLEVESARIRAHTATFGQQLYLPNELDGEVLPKGAYEVAALVNGSTMSIRLRSSDAVQYTDMRLARPMTVTDSITPILRGSMMTEGSVYTMDVFSPLSSTPVKMQLEWIDDRTFTDELGVDHTQRVVELRYSNMKSTVFVDSTGAVVRREIPLSGMSGAVGKIPEFTPSSVSDPGSPKLVFERIDLEKAIARYPNLIYIPRIPDFEPADFEGEDQGRVINLNIANMLTQGLSK